MTRVAGAILAGFSLLGIIGIRLGHRWIAVQEITEGFGRPSVREVIPTHDLLLVYACLGIGLFLLFWRPKRRER
jgi:hypothetical protein